MSYGRKSFSGSSSRSRTLARQRNSRNAVVAARRTGNKQVAKVLKKPTTMAKTRTGRNTSAIVTLARQVKQLQRSQIGPFQRQTEFFELPNTTFWRSQNPICFAMNNFLHDIDGEEHHTGSPVYIGELTPAGSLPQQPIATKAGHFENFYPDFGTGTNEVYNMWFHEGKQTASPIGYRPLRSNITLEVTQENMSYGDVVWCRFDIIKPKNSLPNSAAHQWSLPANIMALGNLASAAIKNRNRINRELFTIVATKWVKIANYTNQQKDVTRRCRFNFKFPDKKYRPEERLHAGDQIQLPTTSHQEVTTNFLSQMKRSDIYWLVCNTSYNANNKSCRLNMHRYISWRDAQVIVSHDE